MQKVAIHKIASIINIAASAILVSLVASVLYQRPYWETIDYIVIIIVSISVSIYTINNILGIRVVNCIQQHLYCNRSKRVALRVLFTLVCFVQSFFAMLIYTMSLQATDAASVGISYNAVSIRSWVSLCMLILILVSALVQMITVFPVIRLSRNSHADTIREIDSIGQKNQE